MIPGETNRWEAHDKAEEIGKVKSALCGIDTSDLGMAHEVVEPLLAKAACLLNEAQCYLLFKANDGRPGSER